MTQWLLSAVVLLISLLGVAGRMKPIDYDALEKAWEAGDAEEELRTEGEEHYRQLAEKSDEEAKALGPQMIFVTIQADYPAPLPDIASRWKEMLWNGGVEVNMYEVAESKLLVGLQRGVFVEDVMRFLKDQHEVKEYEWNGKTYLAGSSVKRYLKRKKSRSRKTRHRRGRHNKEPDGLERETRDSKRTEEAKDKRERNDEL